MRGSLTPSSTFAVVYRPEHTRNAPIEHFCVTEALNRTLRPNRAVSTHEECGDGDLPYVSKLMCAPRSHQGGFHRLSFGHLVDVKIMVGRNIIFKRPRQYPKGDRMPVKWLRDEQTGSPPKSRRRSPYGQHSSDEWIREEKYPTCSYWSGENGGEWKGDGIVFRDVAFASAGRQVVISCATHHLSAFVSTETLSSPSWNTIDIFNDHHLLVEVGMV